MLQGPSNGIAYRGNKRVAPHPRSAASSDKLVVYSAGVYVSDHPGKVAGTNLKDEK